jgi:hypothetical protein
MLALFVLSFAIEFIYALHGAMVPLERSKGCMKSLRTGSLLL